jgi:WD40 repeat protein
MIRFRDPRPPTQAGFTADGRHLLAVTDSLTERGVTFWDWSAAVAVDRVASDTLGVSPNGAFVAYRGAGMCAVFAWPGREPVGTFDLRARSVQLVAVAPDGSEVAAPHAGRLVVWDLAAGAVKARLRSAFAVRYSPGGRWLSEIAGGKAVFLDRSAGYERLSVPGTDREAAAAVAPDDATAAVVGRTVNTVVLWDLPGGRERQRLTGHKRSVKAVTFSPDGRRVLTGGADGTARVWDAATGECLRVYDWRVGEIDLVAWSPDGTTCAAVNTTWAGEFVVWDVDG